MTITDKYQISWFNYFIGGENCFVIFLQHRVLFDMVILCTAVSHGCVCVGGGGVKQVWGEDR